MKEIIIIYILEYLIMFIPALIYELLGLNNLNYFIIHYLPIITIIFNSLVILYLTKKNPISINIISEYKLYNLISIGISISCIYNTIIFRIVPPTTTNNIPLSINILSSGLIGPILEEILFRHILLNKLLKKHTTKKSLIISILIFSLIHLSIIKIIYTIILGTILGISYLHSNKNILYPIAIHISANIISLLLLKYNIIILLLSLTLLIINIYLLLIRNKYNLNNNTYNNSK